jgi:hypothetical protein
MEELKHSIIQAPNSTKSFLNFIALTMKKLTPFNRFT